MNKPSSTAILIGLAATLAAAPAGALVNPNFTPIHVVDQSAMIAVVEVPEKIEGKQISLRVAKTLKGDSQQKSLSLDLSTASPPEQGEAIRGLLTASAGRQALLFAGKYVEQAEFGEGGFGDGGFGPGPDVGGEQVDAQAFLHVDGKWIALYTGDGGKYQVRKVDDHMEGTWAGGTDMLCRAVRYILTDEAPEVPSVSGVSWGTQVKIATLKGKVSSAQPVWLQDDRRPCLFLPCDQGDRLFRFDVKRQQFQDLTGTGNSYQSLASPPGAI